MNHDVHALHPFTVMGIHTSVQEAMQLSAVAPVCRREAFRHRLQAMWCGSDVYAKY